MFDVEVIDHSGVYKALTLYWNNDISIIVDGITGDMFIQKWSYFPNVFAPNSTTSVNWSKLGVQDSYNNIKRVYTPEQAVRVLVEHNHDKAVEIGLVGINNYLLDLMK